MRFVFQLRDLLNLSAQNTKPQIHKSHKWDTMQTVDIAINEVKLEEIIEMLLIRACGLRLKAEDRKRFTLIIPICIFILYIFCSFPVVLLMMITG